jgi:hypothetical protein
MQYDYKTKSIAFMKTQILKEILFYYSYYLIWKISNGVSILKSQPSQSSYFPYSIKPILAGSLIIF